MCSTNINCTVASQFIQNTWVIDLHPVLSNQAQIELNLLMDTLATHQPQQDLSDKRSCFQSSNVITTAVTNYLHSTASHGNRQFVWWRAIPNTCKIFLWLAFRGRLNTNGNRAHKNWTSDPHCGSCPAIESADHITLQCELAKALWTKLDLKTHAIQSRDILHFIEQVLMSSQDHLQPGWPICFVACSHNLWKVLQYGHYMALIRSHQKMHS